MMSRHIRTLRARSTLCALAIASLFTLQAPAQVTFPWESQQDSSINWLDLQYQRIDSALAMGRLDEALALAQEAVSEMERREGARSDQAAEAHNRRGVLCAIVGQAACAEQSYVQALSIRQELYGDDHPLVGYTANSLAELYLLGGDYAGAAAHYQISVPAFESTSPGSFELAMALNGRGYLHLSTGRFLDSRADFDRANGIYRDLLGEDHVKVAQTTGNLGLIARYLGEYETSERRYFEALEILERLYGERALHLDVGKAHHNLGALFTVTGDHERARAHFDKALEIYLATVGPMDREVAMTRIWIAGLCSDSGDFDCAGEQLQEALEIQEFALPPGHPALANTLNSLGVQYTLEGRYAEAEDVLRRALELLRMAGVGEDHPDTSKLKSNLAHLYLSKGDVARARPLLQEATDAMLAGAAAPGPETASQLNSMAEFDFAIGAFDEAEELCLRSLDIYRQTGATDHPSSVYSMANLAAVYMSTSRYALAEALLLDALDLAERRIGSSSPVVFDLQGQLGSLALLRGRLDDAEALLVLALDGTRATRGSQHPDVAQTLESLVQVRLLQGDEASALEALREVSAIHDRNLALLLGHGTESQKTAYAGRILGSTALALSVRRLAGVDNPPATEIAFSAVLNRKGRVLEAMTATRHLLGIHASDPEVKRLLDERDRLHARLSGELRRTASHSAARGADAEDLAALWNEVDGIEYEIGRVLGGDASPFAPVTVERIAGALPGGTALVEYVKFPSLALGAPPGETWESERYAAFVLPAGEEPRFIDLGLAGPIDLVAGDLRSRLANPASAFQDASRRLDDLILVPVLDATHGAETLIIAPDSTLNLVPFEALVDGSGELRLEKTGFRYLTTGRDLLSTPSRPRTTEPAVLVVADPAFDALLGWGGGRAEGEDLADIHFPGLPGTSEEATAIGDILPVARIYTGEQATETVLQAASGPRILHVATHGFFLDSHAPTPVVGRGLVITPEEVGESPLALSSWTGTAGENPLLRSGLALAGANHRGSSTDDGVLTALEASSIDLVGTQLVVLSACETGVGETWYGEGVYGLRRSFLIAGAENVISSLWKVDDSATRDLMVRFYVSLRAGADVEQGLRDAQRSIRADARYTHPYYWSAFVLTQANGLPTTVEDL